MNIPDDDAAQSTLSTAWRQAREELYAKLLDDSRAGLDARAVEETRKCFESDGQHFVLSPILFEHPDDAVLSVCSPLPGAFAHECRQIAETLVAGLPKDSSTGHDVAYVNEEETMHVSLFDASRLDELMPGARTRQDQDVASLKKIASTVQPIALRPLRVLLCSSGALVLLFEPAVNAVDPFAFDRIRLQAQQLFPVFPKKQARAIIHTTLARVLSTNLASSAIEMLQQRCEEVTAALQAGADPVVLSEMWYVDETHALSSSGPTTVFPFSLGKQDA